MRYSFKILRCQILFAILAVLILPLFSVNAAQSAEIINVTPTRLSFSLDAEWKFRDDSVEKEKGVSEKWYQPTYSDASWGSIKIPDPWWKCKETRTRWYRKNLILPASFKDKTIILRFMSAMEHCKVWLNGNFIGEHSTGGSCPFQFDVSGYINYTSPNLLTIKLYWPKQGGSHVHGKGMEGEIFCLAIPKTHIGKALIDTSYPGWFRVRLNIQKANGNNEKSFLSYEIKEHKGGKSIKKGDVCELKLNAEITKYRFEADIKNALPWAPECPNLYDIYVYLKDAKGKMIDVWKDTIGFRTFEAKDRNFYLNGKIFHPFGNGCGVYPRDGDKERKGGGPESIGAEGRYPLWTYRKRFEFYRNMGVNLVRSHVGSMRADYGPIMDEIGMMHEIELDWPKGIINYTKDITKGKERAYSPELINKFRELIECYYNRPSTVMWCTGNERWNVRTKPLYAIPLCNELYDTAKSIDPYRLVINFDGAYMSENSIARALLAHVDKLKSDVATVHGYWGWYIGPIQTIAININYVNSFAKKPLITTESIGCYVGDRCKAHRSNFRKWIGEKRHKSIKWQSLYAARNNKETLEYERMHPDIFAGSCYCHNMYMPPTQKALKRVYSPMFTCLDIDAKGKNYFSGENIPVTLYVLNDYLYKSIKNADLTVELVDSSGKKLFQWEKNVSLPVTSFQTFPLDIKIPENISTGNYSIKLYLKEEAEQLNDNSYQIFVMSRKEIPSSIQTVKKVLVIENEKDNSVSSILGELDVKYTKWDSQSIQNNIKELNDYDVLIVGSEVIGNSDCFFEKGKAFREFVSKGGRLLCFEQHSGFFMSWIPINLYVKGSSSRKHTALTATQCSFIDIKDFSHPIFKGISSIERFDTWNGDYGIISDTLFASEDNSVKDAVLGVAGAPERVSGYVILDFKYGKGEYLLSQLNAVNRWGKDPVATRYIVNLLTYIIDGPSAAKVLLRKAEKDIVGNGPFTPDENGFIRHWLVCGPFPNPGGRPYGVPPRQLGFSEDYLLKKHGALWNMGETEIEPVPGMKEEALFPKEIKGHNWWKLPEDKKLDLRWNRHASGKDYIDLLKLTGYFQNSSAAYAACYVESPKEMEAKVKMGSDDGYKMWVNHKLVAKLNTLRGANPDQEEYKVKLNKGINPILLKITQDTGGFGFYFRFTDLNDKPLTDLKVWLVPNK